MEYDRLAARAGAGVLDSGDVLSAAAVRRIACDARVVPAVLDGNSAVLDVGRAQRTIAGPLRRALVIRDGGCVFPACDLPPAWSAGHHIRHWADGGPTSLDNSVLLCPAHHRGVHHDGWEVRIAADGLPEFIPPRWIDSERKPRRHFRHRKPPPHRHAA